jgi:TetR/AcrR family transcriptional regulator
METKQESQEIRQRIISFASRLFGEKGLEGVSVREIAAASQVNLAMISYYFGGKEGLYLECISHFAQSKLQVVKTILTPVESAEEFKLRLKMLVENKMKSFSEDIEAHKIIMREMQTKRDPEFQKKIMEQLFPLFDLMKDFFVGAKKKKILRSELDPEQICIMLMGLLSHPCVAESAIQCHLGYSMTEEKHRDRYVENVCQVLFAGILK